MSELWELSAHELSGRLERGEVSAVELYKSVSDRLAAVEGDVHSFLHLTREEGADQAQRVDERRRSGEALSPLAGIPIALKDNLATRGVPTTCASKILAGYRPPYDATVVARFRELGLPFLGKTNLDEFAMGSSSENSAFGVTRNPWDLTRVPGGSSAGSAAAVAAGQAVLALGSDTGGSIRQPAAFCGVVGLKPTYGRVSRYGLLAFASSLDQIGPFARDVTDAALLLTAIAGRDPRDETSAEAAVPDYRRTLDSGVAGMRFGIPRQYLGSAVAPEIRERLNEAARLLESLGARGEECDLPNTEYALAAYYLIAPAEASSNLARYDGIRYGYRSSGGTELIEQYAYTRGEGFGPEVKLRIMLGTYALSAGYYDAYYLKAQKVRTLIRRDFDTAFQTYDFLLTPTSPTVAFPIGERAQDPLAMYQADILTIPVNLAGLPAISVPAGLANGLPVGLQFIGPAFGEESILRAARAYETVRPESPAWPALGKGA